MGFFDESGLNYTCEQIQDLIVIFEEIHSLFTGKTNEMTAYTDKIEQKIQQGCEICEECMERLVNTKDSIPEKIKYKSLEKIYNEFAEICLDYMKQVFDYVHYVYRLERTSENDKWRELCEMMPNFIIVCRRIVEILISWKDYEGESTMEYVYGSPTPIADGFKD